MRAVTLKAAGDAVAQLIGYCEGLARDQLCRDGVARRNRQDLWIGRAR